MEIEDLIMKMKDVYLADKLENIFQYLIDYAPSPISYFISDYTKYSQPVLSLLLRKGNFLFFSNGSKFAYICSIYPMILSSTNYNSN